MTEDTAAMDSISHIKRQVEAYVGKNVTIRADRGRKRKSEYTGTLTGAYANVFTLSCILSGVEQNLTYSYHDILTGNVLFLKNKKGA